MMLGSTPLEFKVGVGENRLEIDLSRDPNKLPVEKPLNSDA